MPSAVFNSSRRFSGVQRVHLQAAPHVCTRKRGPMNSSCRPVIAEHVGTRYWQRKHSMHLRKFLDAVDIRPAANAPGSIRRVRAAGV